MSDKYKIIVKNLITNKYVKTKTIMKYRKNEYIGELNLLGIKNDFFSIIDLHIYASGKIIS